MRMTFVLSAGILIFNLFFHKPVVESILFSIALAVGLAPELLPAILVTTLSAGAMRMAKDKVIVKKLAAIQDLGAINILCSDKTGTLTVGSAQVHAMADVSNQSSDKVRLYAYLNAVFETGFTNPLDEAIRQLPGIDTAGYVKADEVPYDFLRKRAQHRGGERRKAPPHAHEGRAHERAGRVQPRRDAGRHADPDGHGQAGHPEHIRGSERPGIADDRVGLEGRERATR
jgi:magnesium-transporting ATPase (P-type)